MELSRPYMIGLGAVVALALLWFLALRPHPGAAGSPAASGHSTPSLPGTNGLANAVAKAHGAVTTSQQNAQQLQAKSAGASSAATPAPSVVGAAASPGAAHAPTTPSGATAPAGPGAAQSAPIDRSASVARDLAAGKVVVILFWNPLASDDAAVRHEVGALDVRHGRLAVYYATPGQVASFGTITTGVSVNQTPTVLVINHQGLTSTLTGLTDTVTIQQAIDDAAKGGAGKVQAPVLTAFTPRSSHAQFIARANALCRPPANGGRASGGTLRQQIDSLHGLLAVAVGLIHRMRTIPAPAPDRPHLVFLFGAYERASQTLDGALTAVQNRQPVLARTLLLRSQVLFDQATQGLADYGLSTCFPQQAR